MQRLTDDLVQGRGWMSPPDHATVASNAFYRQFYEDFVFTSLQLTAVSNLEDLTDAIVGFLEDMARRDLKEVLKPIIHNTEVVRESLEATESTRAQVSLVRSVENLLVYLAEILREIFIQSPATLRSQESVALEDVLAHESLDDFVQWAADRRVTDLSFKGYAELERYFNDRLKLTITDDPQLKRWFGEAVAVRNLFVHRRGRVDERYLRVSGDAALKVGDEYEVSRRDGYESLLASRLIVQDLDERATAKFRLKTVATDAVKKTKST
ncbi:hypothetical protein [Kribbella sp. NPDC051718]|uniref:hypothetical protein n=1 Tax=Kribbella sp. NPDC051718 TaxID=3155168 RepID=UPI0034474F5C